MNVLFVSPEAAPFAKTGGLGDVAGALPGALKKLGIDIRIVLPFYRKVREGNFDMRIILEELKVPLGKEWLSAGVLETANQDGVPVYLLDREDMYDRPNLYGTSWGDYYDNLERFSFFCHAVLRIAWSLSFRPDIIHCNDWQCGLVPALLKGPYQNISFFQATATVFTIHNLGYQGLFNPEKLPLTGLSYQSFF
ncbi:MAG: glycogen/starch synthase, partial [Candidatus Bathyarchaeia archaeon]